MDSALSLRAAAPSPGANIFSDLHRRRAGKTADRVIALIVKRIVGDVMLNDVIPDVSGGPAGQWVNLDQAKLRISLDYSGSRARCRLITSYSSDPRPQAREHLA